MRFFVQCGRKRLFFKKILSEIFNDEVDFRLEMIYNQNNGNFSYSK